MSVDPTPRGIYYKPIQHEIGSFQTRHWSSPVFLAIATVVNGRLSSGTHLALKPHQAFFKSSLLRSLSRCLPTGK